MCFLLGAVYSLYEHTWDMDDDIAAWIMPILFALQILFASAGFITVSTTVFMENIPKKVS